jgi:hypothetical protein
MALGPVFGQEETEYIYNRNKPFLTYSYGTTFSWLTRIIEQNERSNFVLRNFLPGLYFTMELQNIPLVTPEVRLAFYYPLISTFNHVHQKSNTPLHFAIDLFAGACFEIEWGKFSFNAGPGLHMFYLRSDRWNYLNFGIAATAGIEFAINSNISLLFDVLASLDNGNLGGNRVMEPFDTVFQYQTGIGVRYVRNKRTSVVNLETDFPLEDDLQ